MRALRRQSVIVAALVAAAWHGAAAAADQALIDAAKKEGQVTWYTTEIVDQLVRPAAAAFEKKYGVRVNYVRDNSSELALRIAKEAQAGRSQDDVFDGSTTVVAVKKLGLAAQWIPDDAARLPRAYVDPQGYWVATNLYVLTPAYNTNLVAKANAPRAYADLLDPRWRGKMVWAFSDNSSAAPGFIGIVLTAMGEQKGLAYLKALARQKIASVEASPRLVLNQIISGEYPIGLQMFNDQVAMSRSQGAPVDWIAMNPAMIQPSVIGLSKSAPHPNAGKLLIDFLISREGQQLFRQANYIAVDPAEPPLDPRQRPDGVAFQGRPFAPDAIDRAMPRWVAIYDQLFR